MSEAYSADLTGVASRGGDAVPIALVAANGLGLLAAPTFAIMALLCCLFDRGPEDLFCSGAREASPLTGMAVMYLLMCAFHCAPWLKRLAGRQSGAFRLRSQA
jgi:hypothetical protein